IFQRQSLQIQCDNGWLPERGHFPLYLRSFAYTRKAVRAPISNLQKRARASRAVAFRRIACHLQWSCGRRVLLACNDVPKRRGFARRMVASAYPPFCACDLVPSSFGRHSLSFFICQPPRKEPFSTNELCPWWRSRKPTALLGILQRSLWAFRHCPWTNGGIR